MHHAERVEDLCLTRLTATGLIGRLGHCQRIDCIASLHEAELRHTEQVIGTRGKHCLARIRFEKFRHALGNRRKAVRRVQIEKSDLDLCGPRQRWIGRRLFKRLARLAHAAEIGEGDPARETHGRAVASELG